MSRTRHRGGAHPGLREQHAAAAAAAGAEAQEGDGWDPGRAAAAGRRGNRRQSRQRALKELTAGAPLAVEDGGDPDLSRYWQSRELAATQAAVAAAEAAAGAGGGERPPGASASGLGPAGGRLLYDEAAVVAYAAARLPACYAALQVRGAGWGSLWGKPVGGACGTRPIQVLEYGVCQHLS